MSWRRPDPQTHTMCTDPNPQIKFTWLNLNGLCRLYNFLNKIIKTTCDCVCSTIQTIAVKILNDFISHAVQAFFYRTIAHVKLVELEFQSYF